MFMLKTTEHGSIVIHVLFKRIRHIYLPMETRKMEENTYHRFMTIISNTTFDIACTTLQTYDPDFKLLMTG
jgi:hypothetical protein